MKRKCLWAVLVVVVSAFTAHAGTLAEQAEAKLDKATFEMFKDEIRRQPDKQPEHVLAYAIVKVNSRPAGTVGA